MLKMVDIAVLRWANARVRPYESFARVAHLRIFFNARFVCTDSFHLARKRSAAHSAAATIF